MVNYICYAAANLYKYYKSGEFKLIHLLVAQCQLTFNLYNEFLENGKNVKAIPLYM